MWLLHLLPTSLILWIVNTLLVVGVIGIILGFFVKFIPVINTYRLPIQIGSIIIFCVGLWWQGGYSVEQAWRERVEALEAQVARAEEQSKTANQKIKTKTVTRIQIVKVRGEDQIKYIDREIVRYDEKFAKGGTCEIPREFIKAHNAAAEQPK
jgi:hypothetical protein